MNDQIPIALFSALAEGKVKAIEVERLLNALTRAEAGVPTGKPEPTRPDGSHLQG